MAAQPGNSSVRFVDAAPKIHIIPADMETWAQGERATTPTEFELTHADRLSNKALKEANMKERKIPHYRPSRFREDFDTPYDPSLAADSQYNGVAQNPTHLQVQQPIVPVDRKPVPANSRSISADSKFGPQTDDRPIDVMKSRTATSHSFDDFLTRERCGTMDDCEVEKLHRMHKVNALATKGLKKAKLEAVKVASRVEDKVHDFRTKGH